MAIECSQGRRPGRVAQVSCRDPLILINKRGLLTLLAQRGKSTSADNFLTKQAPTSHHPSSPSSPPPPPLRPYDQRLRLPRQPRSLPPSLARLQRVPRCAPRQALARRGKGLPKHPRRLLRVRNLIVLLLFQKSLLVARSRKSAFKCG